MAAWCLLPGEGAGVDRHADRVNAPKYGGLGYGGGGCCRGGVASATNLPPRERPLCFCSAVGHLSPCPHELNANAFPYFCDHHHRCCYCCWYDVLLQPPVSHPPAGILPFLDVESIEDTGFRLARLTREDCSFMGPDCVVAKVRQIDKYAERLVANMAGTGRDAHKTDKIHT